ncbi:hypothetical protein H072_1335 [Dactylellina haptotyla CBS 200.50]|uniref:Uncharacterized protein n=1 Tax=Dactylellina haptotyla (strain CBS 200.50) TaxID=1284197 RepID=S8AUK6_DACHA|nr:hypothetical protein H072_1335 [Dactylellina haptotyla CBS 200.50]
MGKNVDPTRAITEEEPWAIAQQAGKGISQLRHKDQFGNEIVDPDRSNPTRHRMERPLDTIRNFEKAIYNDYERDFYPRRSNRHGNGSTYDQQASQRGSTAYQYGDQSARQSVYENYENGNSYSQRPHLQNRNSGYDNLANNNRSRQDIPSDANSGTYSNGGGSGWSGDPYSTNPSSDASNYGAYEQQQSQQPQQYARLPLGGNDKPLPNANRYSGSSPSLNYQNGGSQPQQYQQNGYSQQSQQNGQQQQHLHPQQQYGSYSGHSQFSSQNTQYGQSYGQQQPQAAWNQQQAPMKTVLTKSSAAADGKPEKRKSWFRRSKS